MKKVTDRLLLYPICLLLIITLIILVGGCTKPMSSEVESEQLIELNYSSFFPAQYVIGESIEAWAEEIKKRTDGRVNITIFHGGSLTTAENCYEGVVKGTSDIGLSCFAYTSGRFPLLEVLDLPGYPFNAIVTTRVANDFYKKFKPQELDDTHVLYLIAHAPGNIFSRKPIRTLEDFDGKRIRATGLSATIVESLGGVPVAMPKGDQYDALLKDIVDGSTSSFNELKGWRLAEVAQYSTGPPETGYVTAMYITMNLDKWNSLPDDVKKIFTEVSEEWVEYTGEKWNESEVEGIEYGKQYNHEYYPLPQTEKARWIEKLQHLKDEYVVSMESKGLPGKDALEFREQLIEKYAEQYPSLQFH